MYQEKISMAFERENFKPQTIIRKDQFYDLINGLHMKNVHGRNKPFNEEVTEEIWIEAAGEESDRVEVRRLTATIAEAQ